MINNMDKNTQGGFIAFITAIIVFTLLLAIGSGEEALKILLAGVMILIVIMIVMIRYEKMTGEDVAEDEANDEVEEAAAPLANAEKEVVGVVLKKENPLEPKPKEQQKPENMNPEQAAIAKLIEQTLSEFGVPAKVVSVKQGPRLTQYGIEPGFIEKKERNGTVKRRKVKASTIYGLEEDLALALAVKSVRLARAQEQSYIGMEVPNQESEIVPLDQILAKAEGALPIALGADVTGQPITADITKMPHALIAGATNSGKSSCIQAILASLLKFGPEKVKLLLIDPKIVELVPYNGIPHLLEPVITDMQKAVCVLEKQIIEMNRRYELFGQVGRKNLESYNNVRIAQSDASCSLNKPNSNFIINTTKCK